MNAKCVDAVLNKAMWSGSTDNVTAVMISLSHLGKVVQLDNIKSQANIRRISEVEEENSASERTPK